MFPRVSDMPLSRRLLVAPVGVILLFAASVLAVLILLSSASRAAKQQAQLADLDISLQASVADAYKGLGWAAGGVPAKRIDSLFKNDLARLDSLRSVLAHDSTSSQVSGIETGAPGRGRTQ